MIRLGIQRHLSVISDSTLPCNNPPFKQPEISGFFGRIYHCNWNKLKPDGQFLKYTRFKAGICILKVGKTVNQVRKRQLFPDYYPS